MKLREWIEESRTEIAAFARAIPVSRPTVYRWIAEEVIPSREHMARLVELTGGKVGPADFYAGPAHGPTASPPERRDTTAGDPTVNAQDAAA